MKDCVFCKIISGEEKNYKIYENENFLAFLDINPVSLGHTLVIPKIHYRWVWDIAKIGEYMEVCQKIAKHYQRISGNELVKASILGTEIEHAHIHLVPNLDGNEQMQVFENILATKGILNEEEMMSLMEKLRP